MTTILTRPDTPAVPTVEPTASWLRAAWTLCRMELRLLTREPMVAFGMVGFPAITVLVLAGVFGDVPDPDFGGVPPSDHYLAGYLAVVLGTLGLVTIPVHIATRREHGVLRRFRAAGVSTRALVASELVLGAVVGTVAAVIVLGAGTLVYGISAPADPVGVVAWFLLGLGCFIAVGSALGLVLPSGRAASAVGNMVNIPMFLLGGGGPPRAVMTEPMALLSDILPLTHLTGGLRQAWLGTTDDPHVLLVPVGFAVVAVVAALWGAGRQES